MVYPLLTIIAAIAAAASTPSPTAETAPERATSAVERLPGRTLACTVGRATNLDPSRIQKVDEIVLEGSHPFSIYLPSVTKWHGPPPDPSDDPLPVDPALRVLSDPAGLTKNAGPKFDRVVDMWPIRVELVEHMAPPLGKLIIISDIDPIANSARISITQAADAASLDINNMYLGACHVASQQT